VETDVSKWPDFEGDIPDIESGSKPGFMGAVVYYVQKWDNSKDNEVPDLRSL